MKVLWGTSLDPIRDGDRFDGEVFAAAETDTALLRELDAAEKQEAKILSSANLPRVWYMLMVAAVVMLSGFFPRHYVRRYVPLFEALRDHPGLFWFGAGCVMYLLVIWVVQKARERRVNMSKEHLAIRQRIRSAQRACYDALGIPRNTTEVDIFSMCYHMQDGEVKPVNRGAGDLFNTPVRMWRRDDTLCMADVDVRLEVSLACVTTLTYRQSAVRLDEWNKRRSWRQYTADGVYAVGKRIYVKGYCILSMQYKGETYQLWLPGHEKTAIEKLTGCQAVEVQASRADEKRTKRLSRAEERISRAKERKDRRKLRMKEEEKKRSANRTPLKPVFYMHVPKMEEVIFLILPCTSGEEVSDKEATLEMLLVLLQMVALFVPMALSGILWPEKSFSTTWRSLLWLIGAFIMGVGLRSIIAAWVKQYPGHIYTAACFLVGAAMMAVGMLA